MEFNKQTVKALLGVVCGGIAFAAALLHLDVVAGAAGWLLGILSPLLLGCAIAFILNVPMRAMERCLFPHAKKANKLRRPLALLLTVAAVSAVLALAGMTLVGGVNLQQDGLSAGLLCAVLSAVLYALMVVFNKKAQGVSGLENTLWQLVFAFATIGGLLLFSGDLPRTIPAADLPAVAVLGIVNTGLACYLYFSSIQVLPAQSVSICGYLDPLSALFFSALFLKERLTAAQLVGALLILGGAAVAEGLERCVQRRRAEAPKQEDTSAPL